MSGRVAWWGTALLRGHIAAAEFLDALGPDYVAHVVVGHPTASTLVDWVLEVRGDRSQTDSVVDRVGLAAVYPEPGDPFGLAGPAGFNAAALDVGEAVLAVGPGVGGGLVPEPVGRAIEWHSHDTAPRVPPDLGEADRELRSVLVHSVAELARLDVAKWRPEVADELQDLRHGAPLVPPPGVPSRAADLARRALHLWSVVDLATVDDGAAVSASQARARDAAVLPLGRAARRALTVACSPDGWPPAVDETGR